MANCKNCGAAMQDGAEVCAACGATNAPAAQGEFLNGKDKTMIILLAVFLGGWGVHNFVLGETKKGIIKLVGTFCTGGILTLVLCIMDIIKVAQGTYVVDPDAFI